MRLRSLGCELAQGYYQEKRQDVAAETVTMAGDLRNQQDSNAGVSLDEEMTNLVKFQNSYKAAAKLITTADEMLQTVIGLKQ